MHFGAAMFFTDYSMGPGELGQALEERGFESVWVPEHSHIPTSLMTPFPQGGELPKKYYDAMDPFVALTAAAMATRSLKIGTGVCLVAQRDPIQTAKACRLDRPGLRRPLFVRGRRGLERGRDGRSWHRVQNEVQTDARAHRRDEGDLDQIAGRISRRVRRFSTNDDLAQASATAASSSSCRGRLSSCCATCPCLWRRMDPACQPPAIYRCHRIPPALLPDGGRGWSRAGIRPSNGVGGRRRLGPAKATS